MRILIVNGYSLTEKGKRQFDSYCDLIRKVIYAIKQVFLSQKQLLDTETEFFTRDVTNLDDFLFDAESGYSNAEAARQFNFLDFIFIEMDASLRPWSKFCSKIMVLIRMSIRCNKILLASSAAMHGVVFFTATNLETPVEVINGPQGSPLGDMTSVKITSITQNQYFLDNVTGDLYGNHFDQEQFQNCWIPIANGGIHQRKAAEEFNTVGKYMLKAPTYKPKSLKEVYGIFVSSQDEEICSIKKNKMHDPLFKDVKQEFLVYSKHSWEIHPFNVVNPMRVVNILAESERGPQIIQVNHNILAFQFTVNQKYEESVKVLQNFIVQHLIEIRSMQNRPQSIILANNELRKNKLDLEHLTQQQTDSQAKGEQSKINFEVLTKFRHVGFAGKKANKLEIVKNNAINDNGKLNQAMKTMRQKPTTRLNTEEQQTQEKKGFSRMSTRVQDILQDKDKFHKTGAEIRQMLHPDISEAAVSASEPLWVPGNIKVPVKQQRSLSKPSTRPMTGVSTFKLTRISTAKSRVQMPVPDYDECREKPIIRCSSPYISTYEKDLQEQKVNNSKIIGSKAIRMSVVSTIKSIPPHHLYDNPYCDPGSFQFREVERQKWVGQQNFILS